LGSPLEGGGSKASLVGRGNGVGPEGSTPNLVSLCSRDSGYEVAGWGSEPCGALRWDVLAAPQNYIFSIGVSCEYIR